MSAEFIVDDAARERMRGLARWRARHAARDDWQALVEDLEQEGWVDFFSHPEFPEWQRWLHVRSAMLDAAFYWRYGRRYRKDHGFKDLREDVEDVNQISVETVTPEEIVGSREVLEQVTTQLSAGYDAHNKRGSTNAIKALRAIALEGTDIISPEIRTHVGFKSTACVYEGKIRLREALRSLMSA